ncbi:serine hydrolase [Pseudoclavibacter endophyticus]|uniref:Beta-lactamase family protein n=1 Tax=Pseudoclavibacter endophyticus TaxID=1778590 RepID=A0A6H9WR24_9MICO|nr:serine hydrolase domain-containing protein [Pseudoclavibacter endophyticus]KAB1648764.1 beta-lactamase family protein [Pseudoclavibacter endophyticus]GGA68705.1 serine hydrolase [Pseudoclavibacter endophyticus]
MSLTRTLTDRIDALVTASVERGEAPGIAVGVEIGGETHIAAAGVLSIDGPPMARDSLFRISSMTKPITATVVLRLVEEGLLGLDDPVDRLLPELADRRVLRDPRGPIDDTVPAERPILVRDLLDFTWGFGQQGAQFEGEPWPIVSAAGERDLETIGPPHPASMPDPDTWIARLGELPLMAQPGERWLYHSGSQVLGVLAARAAGRPFDDVLRSRVLEPLGMSETSFWTPKADRLPTSYFPSGDDLSVFDPPAGEWSRPPAFPDGGAGLLSTVDDYLRFGGMLRRGGAPILHPETVDVMTSNHLTPEQRGRVWPGADILGDVGWGYGLAVRSDGSYGWDGGLGTSWTNLPAHDATVVMLSQRGFDGESYPCAGLVDLVRAH